VVDENRGDIFHSSVGGAVSVTVPKVICGEVVTHLQVVNAFLFTSVCLSNRSASSPTLVVFSQPRRASGRLILLL
jgi:hypothetical protein